MVTWVQPVGEQFGGGKEAERARGEVWCGKIKGAVTDIAGDQQIEIDDNARNGVRGLLTLAAEAVFNGLEYRDDFGGRSVAMHEGDGVEVIGAAAIQGCRTQDV